MKRVMAIKPAGAWDANAARDFVVLDAQDRHRRRIVFVGEQGATYLLDLPRPAQLRDGDALQLEDGALVRVTGKAEPLVEISAANPPELARLAWHLGNRHTDVQIIGDRLRIRRDHVLEAMLAGLGAKLTLLDAPFDPEGGAHDAPKHGHAHGHDHAHDHPHHHRHGHG
jgi:urease accessory protein